MFFGVSITIILLSWALRDVSWLAVWHVFKQAKWGWLICGWLAYLASYCIRAKRWGTLLSATCKSGCYRTRLAGIFIGFGANSVLPAFAGEFLRVTVLYRLDGVPFGLVMGSVFAERLLDVGVVFLFLLIPLCFTGLSSSSNLANFPLTQLGTLITLIWLAFMVAASYPNQIVHLVKLFSRKTGLIRFESRFTSITTAFLDGLSALKHPKVSLTALVETMTIWSLNAITFWTGLIAFDILRPGFLGALFIQSVSALSITIPSTPGYVGPFEAGIRFALSAYDVPANTAIAYVVALRFLMLVTIPVIAGVIAAQLGFSKTYLTLIRSTISVPKDELMKNSCKSELEK